MANLVNAQTNKIEDIPQDSLHEALSSGKYNLLKGQDVNVTNPDGELVSLPSEQIPDAIKAGYSFPTQSQLTEALNQQKYGEGVDNALKAFGAGVARGATLGASDVALPKLGVTTPETLRQLQQRNPISSTTGELTGVGATMALAPEMSPAGLVARGGEAVADAAAPVAERAAAAFANPETSPIVNKILAGVGERGAKTLGSAVEGAVYGLGNAVSENALGDSDLNGENILHNVGYGALFGGGLGAALGIAGETGAAAKGLFGKDVEKAALKDAIMENAGKSAADSILPPPAKVDLNDYTPDGSARIGPDKNAAPSSFDEMAARVREMPHLDTSLELPSKQRLLETNDVLAGDSQFPAHQIQIDSLNSPQVRDHYKVFLENGGEDADVARQYEAAQKREGVKLTNQFVQDIAPEAKLTDNVSEGGDKAVAAFKTAYDQEQARLKPAFKEFDKASVAVLDKPGQIIDYLKTAVPDIDQYIMLTPDGWEIAPYKASMGITKETHAALNSLVDTLNEKEVTLGAIRNVRENMRDGIDFLKSPKTAREITQIRTALMDLLQDGAQKAIPDLQLRQVFKDWAINEQNREVMEQIFGGSLNDRASILKQVKSEDVLNKIFANTNTVKAAKEILGDKWNEVVANYLKANIEKATDAAKNGFSSQKFATLLRTKGPELEEALSQHPEILQKLSAITDKMRILPDSPSINPSGSAKTVGLLAQMHKLGGLLTPEGLLKVPGELMQSVSGKLEQAKNRDFLERLLSSRSEGNAEKQLTQKTMQYGAYAKIERLGQQTASAISRGVNAVFKNAEKMSGALSKEFIPREEQEKKFKKVESQVKDLASNPSALIDKIHDITKDLHDIAPETTYGLSSAATRATQFLASKLPGQDSAGPMAESHTPSNSELARFTRYLTVVERPLEILNQVKHGTLTPESMEAVQTVYPKLYAQMKSEMMDKLTAGKKDVPYQTKLMLSMFLGSDLSNSLKPQNIASAQTTSPSPQPQDNGPKPSAKGMGKIESSKSILTAAQASAQRAQS